MTKRRCKPKSQKKIRKKLIVMAVAVETHMIMQGMTKGQKSRKMANKMRICLIHQNIKKRNPSYIKMDLHLTP